MALPTSVQENFSSLDRKLAVDLAELVAPFLPFFTPSSMLNPSQPSNTDVALFLPQKACRRNIVRQDKKGNNRDHNGLMRIRMSVDGMLDLILSTHKEPLDDENPTPRRETSTITHQGNSAGQKSCL